MDRPRRTKAEQTEETTAKLIAVARTVFAEQGFQRSSIENICARAEVTRGALYHHFHDKKALFETVFLQVQAEIGVRIAASGATGDGPFESILAGSRAFLETALDPDVQQIVLRDAPAVLGPDAARLADEEHAAHLLRADLVRLTKAEGLKIDPEAATALINGALNEAALWIAQSPSPQRSLAKALDALERLLTGLRRT